MKKLTEEKLLERLEEWRNLARIELANLWKVEDEQAYKRIVELVKIFFAKEISSGPIKEDLSRPVLAEWLEGINQAATAVKDHYVMKATMQLIEMIQNMDLPEYLRGIASKQWEVDSLKKHIKNIEERCAELIQNQSRVGKGWLPTAENINALPEPVQNYIAGLETNADPPSMVADNIILRDTIKALEKMLEELPEITEAWAEGKAKEIKDLIKDGQDEDLSDPVMSLHYLGLCVDFITSMIEELGLKMKKQADWRGTKNEPK